MRLKGKTAVVTGAGAGIGEATAELFAREGARVMIVDRDAAAANRVAARIGGAAVETDVSDEASVKAMASRVAELFGSVDILVNNAGYGIRGTVLTIEAADWDALMAVNVKGVFLCSKHIIPLMTAGGAVVNTASNVANVGLADRAAYVASKGAVAALTRSMALDHVAQKVRVNAVAPGTTWSSYFDRILETHTDPDGFVAALNARAPMNRVAKPDEIAQAILWLASDEASYATGSILTVDGGMTAW
ncbi:SDR family oxidoreductase [Rhizobium metallidurans]|uniref:NAD(P)-dependent dehydrogenase (Short-subunit alcohol dehydrogenase family) n=1 Tax=Rhizobium metallidurans TaxID=1265931 RepID=A0A7W6CTB7_9HYPH|nr:SDR family oxidoreductase [Rhizobium metallidurans]MBB3966782.1 NAD(P)-dependent dehydrogenase (short-subunit alcohol dehydrogenase family) [Rhizobium metallidurans]